MKSDYLGFVEKLHRDHGDISFMRLVHERAYDLFTPELVREALVDNAEHLVRWERGIEVFSEVFGHSVLTTEGQVWKRQRRMLQPAFTPKRVASYAALMVAAAADGLDAAVPASQNEAVVAMDALFSGLAMDVILRTLFSDRVRPEDSQQAAWATQTLSKTAMNEMFWPLTLPDWLPLPGKAAKRRAIKCLRQLVGGHIAARRAVALKHHSPPREDLLAMLMALRDDETGRGLSETEIFDQCLVNFQAGHETTATALLWWSHLMAEHPDVAQKVSKEVTEVLSGRNPGPDDLHALPWLTASLKEAMRLFPPIGALLSRRTTKAIVLGGWHIPKGALLRITLWQLHRDPRYFTEPHAFCPERFLPDAPPPPRGAWMPFGAGPRVCIGQHFAMLEMTLLAAMLLQRYRMFLSDDALHIKPAMNVTLRPSSPLRLCLQRVA